MFYQLGLAYRALGERHRAVYAFEQAIMRAGERGGVRQRAEWEVLKLTFGVVIEAGFADGISSEDADTPAGFSRDSFRSGDALAAWWGKLSPRFVPYAEQIRVRWRDPSGQVVQDERARASGRVFLVSELDLKAQPRDTVGEWTVEALLDDDVVDRRRVRVEP